MIAFTEIETMDKGQIHKFWLQQKLQGRCPAHLSMHYLQKLTYYKYKEKLRGALPAATLKQLLAKRATDTESSKCRKSNIKNPLTAGTIIKRIWNGRGYQVEVLEKGFLFHGKQYRSLTGIVKAMTGQNKSGPLFFGLKSEIKKTQQNTSAAAPSEPQSHETDQAA